MSAPQGQRIAILRERAPGETRVSATPETVRKLVALGATVAVEQGAGLAASLSDEDYRVAGAEVSQAETVLAGADMVSVLIRGINSIASASRPATA